MISPVRVSSRPLSRNKIYIGTSTPTAGIILVDSIHSSVSLVRGEGRTTSRRRQGSPAASPNGRPHRYGNAVPGELEVVGALAYCDIVVQRGCEEELWRHGNGIDFAFEHREQLVGKEEEHRARDQPSKHSHGDLFSLFVLHGSSRVQVARYGAHQEEGYDVGQDDRDHAAGRSAAYVPFDQRTQVDQVSERRRRISRPT